MTESHGRQIGSRFARAAVAANSQWRESLSVTEQEAARRRMRRKRTLARLFRKHTEGWDEERRTFARQLFNALLSGGGEETKWRA